MVGHILCSSRGQALSLSETPSPSAAASRSPSMEEPLPSPLVLGLTGRFSYRTCAPNWCPYPVCLRWFLVTFLETSCVQFSSTPSSVWCFAHFHTLRTDSTVQALSSVLAKSCCMGNSNTHFTLRSRLKLMCTDPQYAR